MIPQCIVMVTPRVSLSRTETKNCCSNITIFSSKGGLKGPPDVSFELRQKQMSSILQYVTNVRNM